MLQRVKNLAEIWCVQIHKSCLRGFIFVSEHPGDPVLSNCPAFVIEDYDVNCTCQASGNPPAVVTWYGNGVIDSVLVLRNVSRSRNGHNYTCNQYWGGVNSNWRTTTYSLQVHCESTFQRFSTSFCTQYWGGFSGSNWRTWTCSPVKSSQILLSSV